MYTYIIYSTPAHVIGLTHVSSKRNLAEFMQLRIPHTLYIVCQQTQKEHIETNRPGTQLSPELATTRVDVSQKRLNFEPRMGWDAVFLLHA